MVSANPSLPPPTMPQVLFAPLEAAIRKVSGANNASQGPDAARLVLAFANELDRVSKNLAEAGQDIEDGVRALLSRVDGAAPAAAADLRSRAEGLSRCSLRLQAQKSADATEFRRLAALSDLLLGMQAVAVTSGPNAMVEERLRSYPWMDGGDGAVVLLSDVYTTIRELEETSCQKTGEGRGGDGVWVAPSSFERVTTKYWVRDERLHEVLLASVSELPLLVYGRKGKPKRLVLCEMPSTHVQHVRIIQNCQNDSLNSHAFHLFRRSHTKPKRSPRRRQNDVAGPWALVLQPRNPHHLGVLRWPRHGHVPRAPQEKRGRQALSNTVVRPVQAAGRGKGIPGAQDPSRVLDRGLFCEGAGGYSGEGRRPTY